MTAVGLMNKTGASARSHGVALHPQTVAANT